MDQRCRLKRVPGRLLRHLAGSQLPELLVNTRQQFVACGRLAAGNSRQDDTRIAYAENDAPFPSPAQGNWARSVIPTRSRSVVPPVPSSTRPSHPQTSPIHPPPAEEPRAGAELRQSPIQGVRSSPRVRSRDRGPSGNRPEALPARSCYPAWCWDQVWCRNNPNPRTERHHRMLGGRVAVPSCAAMPAAGRNISRTTKSSRRPGTHLEPFSFGICMCLGDAISKEFGAGTSRSNLHGLTSTYIFGASGFALFISRGSGRRGWAPPISGCACRTP